MSLGAPEGTVPCDSTNQTSTWVGSAIYLFSIIAGGKGRGRGRGGGRGGGGRGGDGGEGSA